jgi:hypothetical protein
MRVIEKHYSIYNELWNGKYNIQKYMNDFNIPLKFRHLCLEGVVVDSDGRANIYGLLK